MLGPQATDDGGRFLAVGAARAQAEVVLAGGAHHLHHRRTSGIAPLEGKSVVTGAGSTSITASIDPVVGRPTSGALPTRRCDV
jgi:hypothetical protein